MVKPPLRTKTVGTKLSEAEYAQLEAAARERGLTLSEWCRTVLLASGNGHATKSAETEAASGTGQQALMAELVTGGPPKPSLLGWGEARITDKAHPTRLLSPHALGTQAIPAKRRSPFRDLHLLPARVPAGERPRTTCKAKEAWVGYSRGKLVQSIVSLGRRAKKHTERQ